MKKSILQKPIKQVLISKGFEHIKNNDYALICGDKKTKLILRIPDGKNGHGFVLLRSLPTSELLTVISQTL